MTVQKEYSSILKRSFIILLYVLVHVSPAEAALIVKQPESQTICASQISAIFTVEVVPGDYSYRWFKTDGETLLNSTGPSYTAQSQGEYYCIVINLSTLEEETSDHVTLTIYDVPDIRSIIVPRVCDGTELVASVPEGYILTKGSDLKRYKWMLDGDSVAYGTVTDNKVPNLQIIVNSATHANAELTLTVTNGCGSTTFDPPQYITVYGQPSQPTPVPKTYCQGEKADTMSIVEGNLNRAVWFDFVSGEELTKAPTPNTSTPGTQSWWVLQKVTYPNGPTCVSERAQADVIVRELSALPNFSANVDLCIYDADSTLAATPTGTGVIKWYYDNQPDPSQIAPLITTSKAEERIYYVTQTETDKCESSKSSGKITVRIKDRAKAEDLELFPSNLELCPNKSTIISATSKVANSTFRWYKNSDKSGLFQEGSSTFTTPVLSRDTAYYVTVQYGALCESSYAQASVITVRDITFPYIKAPDNIVVSTNDGVCFATNVQTGFPFVSDNCTVFNDLIVYNEPIAPTIYPLGDTTLVWWVMDEAGLKSSALQAISVRDMEAPRGTCPADIIVEINENEESSVVYYPLDFTDNCGMVVDSLNMGKHSGEVFDFGETRVRHFLSDKAGNITTCDFKVIVRYPPRPLEVTLKPSNTQICPGQEVVITSVASGGSGRYTYSWEPRPWSNAVLKDYPLSQTVYKVTVSDGTNIETKSVQITVLETQQVNLALEGRPMDQIFEGDEVLVTATPGFTNYKLLLNNELVQDIGTNYKVSFQAELGTYQVRVFATDDKFCVTQDQLQIVIDSRTLPNVFTPNHDGINDIFLDFLENTNVPEDFHLQIFTRAGELLYQGNKGWNGYYKGKLMPQGTYMYVVRRKMISGEYRTYKGNVTLKL